MLDIVFIEKFEVATVIGVYDWERNIKQCLFIDLQMGWDNKRAAKEDNISKALDYAKVSQAIEEFAANSQFQLVETFAERLAELLQQQFAIMWLKLKITKPGAVATASGVGVEIERGCR